MNNTVDKAQPGLCHEAEQGVQVQHLGPDGEGLEAAGGHELAHVQVEGLHAVKRQRLQVGGHLEQKLDDALCVGNVK